MRCPACGEPDTRVVDTRATDEGRVIRRRRECGRCHRRFTTHERVDEPPLMVIKKDGGREVFDRRKLLAGILTACHKRPVAAGRLEELVDEIERRLRAGGVSEVSSRTIGEEVMEALRRLDEVAYVRFASVYRNFRDGESFMEEVARLRGESGRV
ncbi:MAG: transcriptional repressor NrdR [Firmicutes bacterium]|nr:transcriptional repressor NrdR [Bacillota bacterium]